MKSTSRKSAKSGDFNDSRATNNILANPGANIIETSQGTGARHSKSRRTATLYDAVAGRVGLNGFLRDDQIRSGQTRAMAPEEVLLRRVNAPDRIPYDYYNADERLGRTQKLPDSDLLKDVHSYVADYYEATNRDGHGGYEFNFKSMDETALIAMGILLEEACKEALGENGDMVFTEPAVYDRQVPRDVLSLRQVIGSVVPKEVQEYHSSTGDSSDDDVDRMESKPRKRQRRRYGNIDAT